MAEGIGEKMLGSNKGSAPLLKFKVELLERRVVELEKKLDKLEADAERGFISEDAGCRGHRFRFGIFCPECKEQHHVYLYSDSLAEQAGSCKCGTCSGRFKIRLSVEREEQEDG